MRETLIIIMTILSFLSALAQDIIVTREAKRIEAKIEEVSETEIRYKEADNLSGPTFVLSTNKIQTIIFKNGSVRNYNKAKEHDAVKQQTVYSSQAERAQTSTVASASPAKTSSTQTSAIPAAISSTTQQPKTSSTPSSAGSLKSASIQSLKPTAAQAAASKEAAKSISPSPKIVATPPQTTQSAVPASASVSANQSSNSATPQTSSVIQQDVKTDAAAHDTKASPPVTAADKPVDEVTFDGTYYVAGTKRMNKDDYLRYLSDNCPEAYDYHIKGVRLQKGGWAMLAVGGAAALAGGIMMGIGIKKYNDVKNYDINDRDWDKDYDMARTFYYSGLGCAIGGGLIMVGSVPMLVIGAHKQKNSYKIHNRQCAKKTAMSLNLTSGSKGLGIAFTW